MTSQEKRDNLQHQAFQQLLENKRVICNWGTGVGKSRVAITFADYMDQYEKKHNILLLVGEDAHKQNWKKEFKETLGEKRAEELLSYIRIECYASLKKCTEIRWDLIIADEGHHLRSEKRIEFLNQMNTERMLVLTATLSEKKDGEALMHALNQKFGDFISLNFSLQNAIDNGILPTPRIQVIPLEMWDSAEEGYENITAYLEKKKKEYLMAIRDTGFFAKTEEELDTLKAKMLHAGSLRKQFMGRLKTKMASRILKDYDEKKIRYICFCVSIDQVKKLGGINIINSKQSNKTNKEIIERFNEEQISSIYTVGMLQEGVSLNRIQAGLIIQLDGKARAFIQKFGRVMRASDPLLKIIYVPDSRDEDYLYNALKDIKQEYIQGWNIEQYEKKYGIMRLEHISTTQLVGPTAYYAAIRTQYQPIPTEIRGNSFIGYYNGQPYNIGISLQGIYGGLMVDSNKGHIYMNIFDKATRIVYALRTSWQKALGLLMPMATATKTHHANIYIRITPEGQFVKTNIWINGTLLNWAKTEIPKDEPGAEGSMRLNFVNNLIRHIDYIYSLGKQTKKNIQANLTVQHIEQPQQTEQQPTTYTKLAQKVLQGKLNFFNC